MITYKLGQAPWETNGSTPQTFALGQAPWETQTQQPVEQKTSGLQAFIQDVARPFLKVPTTVAAGGARLIAGLVGGAEAAQRAQDIGTEGIDYGYFGNVRPIGAPAFDKYKSGEISGGEFVGRSAADLAGTTAEIGSYAIGGGGGAAAVKAGLKGAIKQGVKSGVKAGATSGGLFSFGQSLQDAEVSPMDVAYNTLFGTAVGGVAGGAFGAATPIISKGVSTVKSYTRIPELEAKLAEGYKKIFNPTARQIKADTRFGNDSFKFLAEEMPDMPISVDKNGRVMADDAIEMAKQKYSAEATAFKPIIRNSGKYVDIDQAIANAKAAARKEFDGSDLVKAEQQIDNEVEAYLANSPQDVNVTANGRRFVTLARADDIKSYSWARGKGWGTPEAEVWNDTNNLIGHSLKDMIEKELPEAPIKAMNKRLGQWKNAIDMLERRNNAVSGSGGKLSKYIIRSIGTTVGAGLGGDQGGIGGSVGGAWGGFMTAGLLAKIMSNPTVRLFVVRKILQNLQKAGKQDMIKEAEQILQHQASRYLLPAAGKSSYVEQPIILPKSAYETNLGLNEVKGMNQEIPKNLSVTSPKQAPTTQANKNVNIDKSIPPNGLSGNGAQSAMGGVAGIEVKKDEKGNDVISFNPEKALIGVAGVTGAKNIKVIQEMVKTLFKKEIPHGLFNDLKELTDWVDIRKMPKGYTDGNKFMKDVRTELEKRGIDSFNMTDRKLADLADAVIEKGDEIPKFKQDAITGKMAGSTKVDPLLQEAKKYKTAEEFVKAQGQTLYHGGQKIDVINPQKSKFMDTFFMSDNKEYTNLYKNKYGVSGITNEIVLSPDAKLIDIRNADKATIDKIKKLANGIETGKSITITRPDGTTIDVPVKKGGMNFGTYSANDVIDGAVRGKSHFAENPTLVAIYKKLGYDGMVSYEDVGMRGKNIGVWNKDMIKTKSQLTDIWKKANKK